MLAEMTCRVCLYLRLDSSGMQRSLDRGRPFGETKSDLYLTRIARSGLATDSALMRSVRQGSRCGRPHSRRPPRRGAGSAADSRPGTGAVSARRGHHAAARLSARLRQIASSRRRMGSRSPSHSLSNPPTWWKLDAHVQRDSLGYRGGEKTRISLVHSKNGQRRRLETVEAGYWQVMTSEEISIWRVLEVVRKWVG